MGLSMKGDPWARLVWVGLAVLAGVMHQNALAQESKSDRLDVVDVQATGLVNWTKGTVSARGLGFPPTSAPRAAAEAMASRAAKTVALRNLAEVVQGIQVDSETVVENFVLKNDEIRTRVNGMITNAQILKRQVYSDGSVELRLSMPLWGKDSLSSVFLDDFFDDEMKTSTVDSSSHEPQEGYTGLIVDARELGLKPAAFPLVVDQLGQLVYGPGLVSREAVKDFGLAQYILVEKLENASLRGISYFAAEKTQSPPMTRVGPRPLRIKGMGKSGRLHTNIIISAADAQRIRQDPHMLRALNGAKVIIITDPLVAGVEGKLLEPLQPYVSHSPGLHLVPHARWSYTVRTHKYSRTGILLPLCVGWSWSGLLDEECYRS